MRNTDFLKERYIAHRGLFDKKEKIPENSIIAFQKAIENNYSIELDVHLLKDDKIIVFHDDNLKRMTGLDKKVIDCDYEEIQKLKLDNTENKIPLFEDVLKLVNGKVPILIEIKSDRRAGETENKLMEVLKDYNGKYAVQSFSPFSVLWFRKNYPEIIRGQLSCNFKKSRILKIKKFLLKNLFFNFLIKPDFVSYSIDSFPNKNVEKFKNGGKIVLGWTVRDKSDLEEAKKYCDNIIGEKLKILE